MAIKCNRARLRALKTVLDAELDYARRIDRVYCRAKSRRSNRANRESEVCAIERIKYFCANLEILFFVQPEALVDCNVEVDKAIAARCVATYGAIPPKDEKVC
jgi:hypothetical protein